MKLKSTLLIISLFISFSGIFAQEKAKTFYKDGSKEFKKGLFAASIANFTTAIQLDENYIDAYFYRAKAFSATDQPEKAIEDFDVVNNLDIENKKAWLSNGELNFKLKNYSKASEKYAQYLNFEKKDLAIYNKIISSLYAIQEWQKALKYAKQSLEIKDLIETYYIIGDIDFIIKDYTNAESAFRSVLEENSDHLNARLALAETLYAQGRYDEAIREADKAIASTSYNKKAYLTRVHAFHKKLDYPQAIKDLTKIIEVNKEDDDILNLINDRGDLFLEYSQPMKAIADYTFVINQDAKNLYALSQRAKAYVDITRNDAAIIDYSEIVNLSNTMEIDKNLLNKTKSFLIELKREKNKPRIDIIDDNFSEEELCVPFGQNEVTIRVVVKDENPIKKITIQDGEISEQPSTADKSDPIPKSEQSYDYLAKLDLSERDKITITAEDTYGNATEKIFTIKRIEKNTPNLVFINPVVVGNDTIVVKSDSSMVSFEGKAKDESLIKSLTFNSQPVSFNMEEKNPSFTAAVNLENLSKLTVEVFDIYNNRLTREYVIQRDTLEADQKPLKQAVKQKSKPIIKPIPVAIPVVEQEVEAVAVPIIGESWVVFIENSAYTSFDTLQRAISEVKLMQSALSNYKVDKILLKQNMTKDQMARFFSIELRDLINSNNVNSLIIWYAGQGLYLNEAGYWIPVDAVSDDEFSYYNTNNLKTSMQLYVDKIPHILVVSDACLVGSSFHEPFEIFLDVRKCTDENAIKNRSAQMFFAEDSNLSTENTIFAEIFSNMLIYNTEKCISIEAIVSKVTETMVSKNLKRPQFGKISNFSDENGTFFFLKNQK
ncbi:MAG: tetratricopeptide repeat protein [Bacteroidales bacterium]|nr:tetratricopeptide repeat protein [Bacteroidales bacterium]